MYTKHVSLNPGKVMGIPCQYQGILKGKYHCTVDLLFDWFWLGCPLVFPGVGIWWVKEPHLVTQSLTYTVLWKMCNVTMSIMTLKGVTLCKMGPMTTLVRIFYFCPAKFPKFYALLFYLISLCLVSLGCVILLWIIRLSLCWVLLRCVSFFWVLFCSFSRYLTFGFFFAISSISSIRV